MALSTDIVSNALLKQYALLIKNNNTVSVKSTTDDYKSAINAGICLSNTAYSNDGELRKLNDGRTYVYSSIKSKFF